MSGRLENKIILVTGGAGLIGKAVVLRALEEGALVIYADLTASEAFEHRDACTYYHCDLTNTDEVDQMITSILAIYGRIDGLVNAAYPRTIDWGNAFEEVLYTSWQKQMDQQLNSVFYLSQQVAGHMRNQRSGSIVHIGSIYGVVGNDFSLYEGTDIHPPSAYAAIKGGLINLSRYMASYFGKTGVRVNCVSPGGIWDGQHPDFVARYCEKVPLGRMARAEEIAPPIVFLLSDESSYITGHNLMVDGGWTSI